MVVVLLLAIMCWITMPVPARAAAAKSPANTSRNATSHTSNTPTGIPPEIEQRSWDASTAIDQLLTAEAAADTQAMSNAREQLLALPHENSGTNATAATAAHEQGVAEFDRKKLQNALSDFKKAAALNPWDPDIINDLVRCQIDSKDLKSAIVYCPIAIGIDPSSTTAWCNMAEIFARSKQCDRARGCVYLAYAMSDDPHAAANAIQSTVKHISDPNVKAPFKQALLMVLYVPNDPDSSDSAPDFVGPQADIALYKSNLLLKVAPDLAQLKKNTGMIIAVSISRSGKIQKSEVLRSSGDTTIDNSAIKLVSAVKLPPLPKSDHSGYRQFLIPVDKVVQALSASPS